MNNGFYSGTSGINLPVPNKLSYPLEFQDKSRLTYYSSLFNSIEINSSFYKVPMLSTVKKWVESVPEDFQFTFKLWKEISHSKLLLFEEQDVERFMNVIAHTGLKKGCLLVQFPPGLSSESMDQLETLLKNIRLHDPDCLWKIAVEFRNESWYQEQCYDLINAYQAAVVLHDKKQAGIFISDDHADFVYLRFHGINGDYRGDYPDEVMYEYSQYIKDWLSEGKMVYAYFNNTAGNAVNNLITLNSYVQA
ncbi:MAG: DUF72 domain-containing protein [Daejeonella sp.]